MSTEYNDKTLYKIGFTDDLPARLRQHRTSNPDMKFLMYKGDGERKDEANLHRLCSKWRYSNEWFWGVPEILEIFRNYVPSKHPGIDADYVEPDNEIQIETTIDPIYDIPQFQEELKQFINPQPDRIKELEMRVRILELELENQKLREKIKYNL